MDRGNSIFIDHGTLNLLYIGDNAGSACAPLDGTGRKIRTTTLFSSMDVRLFLLQFSGLAGVVGFLLLVLGLVLGNALVPLLSLLLLRLRSLRLSQCLDPVCWSGKFAHSVRDLSSAYERKDNGCSDNECEDETVHTVPGRSPATLGGTAIGIVEEVEGQELGDEGVFDGQENCRPCDSSCHNSNGISWVALGATETSPLKTPVDSTEEGNDL